MLFCILSPIAVLSTCNHRFCSGPSKASWERTFPSPLSGLIPNKNIERKQSKLSKLTAIELFYLLNFLLLNCSKKQKGCPVWDTLFVFWLPTQGSPPSLRSPKGLCP